MRDRRIATHLFFACLLAWPAGAAAGDRGHTVHAIDHDALRAVLRDHGRLENGAAR